MLAEGIIAFSEALGLEEHIQLIRPSMLGRMQNSGAMQR